MQKQRILLLKICAAASLKKFSSQQKSQTEKKQARRGSKVREPWSLVNLNDKASRAFRNNVLRCLFSACEQLGVLHN